MMGTVSKVTGRNRLWKHSGFQKVLKSVMLLQPVSSDAELPQLALPYALQRIKHFSSERNNPDFFCSNKARIMVKNLDVTTDDFVCQTGTAASPKLNKLLKEAEKAAAEDYEIANLKDLYQRVVRPELVSRCLIHKHPFNHESTWWLKYQTHAMTKRSPKLTTSFDVMEHLKGLPSSDWAFFLNYLAENRTAVVEEWFKISTVENIMYNYGLKDFHGIHFFKGEADGSYDDKKNTADVSIVIWDDEQVIKAETYVAVSDCNSSLQAEAIAAFALLTEAKELGIENLLVWTDNKKVSEVISGKRQVDRKDKKWKLFMALRSMRLLFKRLLVTYVPRELLQLPDGFNRQPVVSDVKTSGSKFPRIVKQSAKEWAYQFNGLPMFDLSMIPEAVKTMSGFGIPLHWEASSTKWYVEVEENGKLSALQNIIQVLQPFELYVAVQSMENKPLHLREELHELLGTSISAMSNTWSILKSESTSQTAKGRTLLVVFDGVYLENDLSCEFEFVISLSNQKDRAVLESAGFIEMSASCLIHYFGARVLTKKAV